MSEVPILFPFSEYWSFYAVFTLFVLGMLALDLGVFHRKAHAVGFQESLTWSAVWITLGLLFSAVLYSYALHALPLDPRLAGLDHTALARQSAMEYLAGFAIEKALAVDNLFVFVVIFSYFAIPAELQHRVLFFGILGALIFRAVFIALGAALIEYHWVMMVFGAFLVFTGIKLLFAPDKPVDPSRNPVLRWVRAVIPVTDRLEGERFFVRTGGVWHATPLFLALVMIEFSDIVFAVDSVPAIFALTREPLIVFTSNVFAILGLRSLYFALAGMIDRFWALKFALGAILIFVGLKMVWLNEAFGGKFPIAWSLGIIVALLAAGLAVSLARPRREEEAGV